MWILRRGHTHIKLETLSEYLDDRLSARTTASVERGIADCAVCWEELEGLRSTVTALRSMPEAAPRRSFTLAGPPPQEGRVRPQPSLAFRLPQWAYAGAACMAALVLALLVAVDVAGLVADPSRPVEEALTEPTAQVEVASVEKEVVKKVATEAQAMESAPRPTPAPKATPVPTPTQQPEPTAAQAAAEIAVIKEVAKDVAQAEIQSMKSPQAAKADPGDVPTPAALVTVAPGFTPQPDQAETARQPAPPTPGKPPETKTPTPTARPPTPTPTPEPVVPTATTAEAAPNAPSPSETPAPAPARSAAQEDSQPPRKQTASGEGVQDPAPTSPLLSARGWRTMEGLAAALSLLFLAIFIVRWRVSKSTPGF